MNYAILLSGGNGSRIDSKIPKQYIRCNGCMMVTRAFSTLAECDNIDGIIVVANRTYTMPSVWNKCVWNKTENLLLMIEI